MRNHKLLRIAALSLSLVLLLSVTSPVFAVTPSNKIYIETAEDLQLLAKNCALDTWSKDKTVILKNDISLEGIDFAPIPTFAGSFNGAGHTISGLSVTDFYSPSGLFAHIQEGAVIQSLHVVGSVTPGGDKAYVGGIVGENSGSILDCTFTGTVMGEKKVGGIAGHNALTGTLTRCVVNGEILGEAMTGGIVGENLGLISQCENASKVNTISVDPHISLDELNAALTVDISKIPTLDTVSATNDTGGIAGYSSGMIIGCNNTAAVGYPHVGYNVGGIVGRSCGHLANNTNSAEVCGRKDVGGIAGQMEPYVSLKLSEDLLGDLQKELNDLKALIDDATYSADDSNAAISSRLDKITELVGSATEKADILAGQVGEYGDQAITEINRGSEIIASTIGMLTDIVEKFPAVSENIANGLACLKEGIEHLTAASEFGTDAIADLQLAVADFESAAAQMNSGFQKISEGLTKLENALIIEDQEAVNAALDMIASGISEISAGVDRAAEATDKITAILEAEDPDYIEVVQTLPEIAASLREISSGLEKVNEGIQTVKENTSFDLASAKDGIHLITEGTKEVLSAGEKMQTGLGHLSDALADTESASKEITEATKDIADAIDEFKTAADGITDILYDAYALFAYLDGVDPLQIEKPNDEIRGTANALYADISEIETQLKYLNSEVSSATAELTSFVRAINEKFSNMMNTVVKMIYNVENSSEEEIFTDASEADIAAVTNGKTVGCENTGYIYGDINVGGITGIIGIEYELDPEDDLSGGVSVVRRKAYEMKAIVQNCVNNGTVVSKKDCVGGICGKMDLGLIIDCEAYGTVKSETGDYVGGFAGLCAGTVRGSFSKCTLSGNKYIGGAIGCGVSEAIISASSNVKDCCCLIVIGNGSQYIGAISGQNFGNYENNYFVSDTLAGINRISYAGKAEPITYEELSKLSGLPSQFKSFRLVFIADGETLYETVFDFGAAFDHTVFPEIPEKDGCYASWDKTDLTDLRFDTVVSVVYIPYNTALRSEKTRNDGKAVFYAQGTFGTDDRLSATLQPTLSSGFSLHFGEETEEQWTLLLPDDGQKTHTIRYLTPDEKTSSYRIYVKIDGRWEKASIDVLGSYITFTAEGTEVEIAVVSAVMSRTAIAILAAGALLLIAAITVIIIKKVRKKKKKPLDACPET